MSIGSHGFIHAKHLVAFDSQDISTSLRAIEENWSQITSSAVESVEVEGQTEAPHTLAEWYGA